MRHALVTGGAGFIGSHLVDRLLAEGGWRVTVLDDFDDFYDPAIKRANLDRHAANPNFQCIEGDIRDLEAIRRAFGTAPVDVVVHMAARAGVRPSLRDPGLYLQTNVAGTLNVLEAVRGQPRLPRVVFASSSSVYGANRSVPFQESDPVATPISPYAATKAAGELLAHTYSHLYGLETVVLRFFTAYGARQRPDLAIHKFARLIEAGRPLPVYGDGSTERDYTYIDDVVAGVRAAMDYKETPYEIINLGESRTVPLREVIACLERALGKSAILDRQPEQPGDLQRTHADISKARRLLGYSPSTPFEEGIARFVEWFRSLP